MKLLTKILIATIILGGAVFLSTLGQKELGVSLPPQTNLTIEEKLINKTAVERANIKGQEIAKIDFRGQHTSAKYGVKIEITSIEKIEGGVQVFARAWKNGKQLGFGKDGTVDIERFRIFNPPVLVDDPNGTILREIKDIDGNIVAPRVLREDPAEAIRQVVSHNVLLVGKDGANIVSGKIGNTTSTFFPAAGQNSPVDGFTSKANQLTWALARDATTADNFGATDTIGVSLTSASAGEFDVGRSITLFDTSIIGTDTINSSIYSLFAINVIDADSDSSHVVQTSPASNSDVVAGDMDAYTFTSGGSNLLSAISTFSYSNITMNATGKSYINKSGITKLGAILGTDLTNTQPTGGNQYAFWLADFSGTASDPKLVIEHSVFQSIISDFILFE